MIKLNLGCGTNPVAGFVNLDWDEKVNPDLVFDLNNIDGPGAGPEMNLPFENDSVSEFLMSHILEHLERPLDVMQELYRIAAPDATIIIRVPHGASDDAWEDQTHLRPYFPGSFQAFGQPYWHRSGSFYTADWEVIQVELPIDRNLFRSVSETDLRHHIVHSRNYVAEIIAFMRAVKPPRDRIADLMKPINVTIYPVEVVYSGTTPQAKERKP